MHSTPSSNDTNNNNNLGFQPNNPSANHNNYESTSQQFFDQLYGKKGVAAAAAAAAAVAYFPNNNYYPCYTANGSPSESLDVKPVLSNSNEDTSTASSNLLLKHPTPFEWTMDHQRSFYQSLNPGAASFSMCQPTSTTSDPCSAATNLPSYHHLIDQPTNSCGSFFQNKANNHLINGYNNQPYPHYMGAGAAQTSLIDGLYSSNGYNPADFLQSHSNPTHQWKQASVSATSLPKIMPNQMATLNWPGTNNVRVRTSDKYRSVYTELQRLELEKEFLSNNFISAERKADLSTHLQLTERQIKIWFQNRRAKTRKGQCNRRF
uniref:Homeobox domain-containing protein n=1 Tax=Ditylenchus dipsaci TaxID=166011 RepID=A0A915DK92_9BILA